MELRSLKCCIGPKLTPGLKNFEHGNACFVHLVTPSYICAPCLTLGKDHRYQVKCVPLYCCIGALTFMCGIFLDPKVEHAFSCNWRKTSVRRTTGINHKYSALLPTSLKRFLYKMSSLSSSVSHSCQSAFSSLLKGATKPNRF